MDLIVKEYLDFWENAVRDMLFDGAFLGQLKGIDHGAYGVSHGSPTQSF